MLAKAAAARREPPKTCITRSPCTSRPATWLTAPFPEAGAAFSAGSSTPSIAFSSSVSSADVGARSEARGPCAPEPASASSASSPEPSTSAEPSSGSSPSAAANPLPSARSLPVPSAHSSARSSRARSASVTLMTVMSEASVMPRCPSMADDQPRKRERKGKWSETQLSKPPMQAPLSTVSTVHTGSRARSRFSVSARCGPVGVCAKSTTTMADQSTKSREAARCHGLAVGWRDIAPRTGSR